MFRNLFHIFPYFSVYFKDHSFIKPFSFVYFFFFLPKLVGVRSDYLLKSTGVIRRIDELGRIVLPKEIRRNLGIRDGESLEIFVEEDKIVLKKFSKIKDFKETIYSICSLVSNVYDCKLLVTDRDKVVYSNFDKEVMESSLDKQLLAFIQNRESVVKNSLQSYTFQGVEKKGYYFIWPIISSTDCLGLILLYSESTIPEEQLSLLKLISAMIVSKVDIA